MIILQICLLSKCQNILHSIFRSRPVIDTFADIAFLPEELDVAKKGCIKRGLNTTW